MKNLLTRMRQGSPAFYYCGMAHMALFATLFMVSFFDHRQLLGINLWIKPEKFAFSIGLYCLTWTLMLPYLPYERIKKRYERFSVVALSFEMLAIGSQAARGQRSHFNTIGTYNALVFSLMGIFIVLQTLFALYIGIRFFKVKAGELTASVLWSIRLGIVMACVFAFEGGFMASRMSHTIGAKDGTPGMPVFNWSYSAGDLRIAHFLGLHALQVIPLFALLISPTNKRRTLLFAGFYFVLVSIVFYQAMLGRPLFGSF